MEPNLEVKILATNYRRFIGSMLTGRNARRLVEIWRELRDEGRTSERRGGCIYLEGHTSAGHKSGGTYVWRDIRLEGQTVGATYDEVHRTEESYD